MDDRSKMAFCMPGTTLTSNGATHKSNRFIASANRDDTHHSVTRSLTVSAAASHWKVMSRHFEMSEPRPEEMVMQPRTFCAVVSLAQIA